MHPAPVAVPVLVLAAACQSAQSSFEEPVAGGLLVRVVDGAGEPVAGAEVLTEREAQDPATYPECLFAGSIGRADRFGAAWLTDVRGEVRIPARHPWQPVVARRGDLWGSTLSPETREAERGAARMIVLEPDRTIEIVATDPEGRPGVGAIAWIGLEPPAGSESAMERHEIAWGATVVERDGSLAIPHAQLWRALVGAGWSVNVATFVLWGDEMVENRMQPFPLEDDAELRCAVSPAGSIVLSAEPSLFGAVGMLRWLDAPVELEDPDEVPEFPIGLARADRLALPLGRRFEIVLEVTGFVDPRIAFDGPKSPGERVEVSIGPPQPAARVTGRLVDEDGNPMPGRAIDAWLEHDGARVEPEEDWLATDDEGRFAFDFAPGGAGTLRITVDAGVSFHSGSSERLVFGQPPSELPPPIVARHEFAASLTAGAIALGNLVCGPAR